MPLGNEEKSKEDLVDFTDSTDNPSSEVVKSLTKKEETKQNPVNIISFLPSSSSVDINFDLFAEGRVSQERIISTSVTVISPQIINSQCLIFIYFI
jgi:hypothetical protein